MEEKERLLSRSYCACKLVRNCACSQYKRCRATTLGDRTSNLVNNIIELQVVTLFFRLKSHEIKIGRGFLNKTSNHKLDKG